LYGWNKKNVKENDQDEADWIDLRQEVDSKDRVM